MSCTGLDRIQIVASMNPSTTVGRHALSPRFTSLMRTVCIGYPDTAQLQTIYGSMLEGVLSNVGCTALLLCLLLFWL